MHEREEIYGIRIGGVYFVGRGKAGFILEDQSSKSESSLTLSDARVRVLQDPSVGFDTGGNFVWEEKHLRSLYDYMPTAERIPTVTFSRFGLDKVVAFPYS
jgi:hypothetical protein